MSFGPEWIIVIGVLVLVFGASQLPKLARSLGQAKSEFEKGQREAQSASTSDSSEKTPEKSDTTQASDKPADS